RLAREDAREESVVGGEEAAPGGLDERDRAPGADAGVDDGDEGRRGREEAVDAREEEARLLDALRLHFGGSVDDARARTDRGDHPFHRADVDGPVTEVGQERYYSGPARRASGHSD